MVNPGESYYDLLNVDENATPEEVSGSYRRLAKVLHPDVCKDPEAEELFKAVNEAYQVLRDPRKREEYDLALLQAKDSQFGDYYKGGKRYRDPNTWYYAHMHQGYHSKSSVTDSENIPQKRSTSTPRILQVFLFYASLFMAITILAQLFLLPWLEGTSANEALNAFEEGNHWMNEVEYQKAIECYTESVTKLPGFSEGWRAKGLAEYKKAETLTGMGLKSSADGYYSESVKSLLQAYKAFPDDYQVISRLGYALAATGDYQNAVIYLRRAQSLSQGDSELSKRLEEALKMTGTSVSARGST